MLVVSVVIPSTCAAKSPQPVVAVQRVEAQHLPGGEAGGHLLQRRRDRRRRLRLGRLAVRQRSRWRSLHSDIGSVSVTMSSNVRGATVALAGASAHGRRRLPGYATVGDVPRTRASSRPPIRQPTDGAVERAPRVTACLTALRRTCSAAALAESCGRARTSDVGRVRGAGSATPRR